MPPPRPFPSPQNGPEAVASSLAGEFGAILSTKPETWLKVAHGFINKLKEYGYDLTTQKPPHGPAAATQEFRGGW